MEDKLKKIRKKRKPSHFRFLVAALVFLIGTIVLVGLFFVLVLIESVGRYFYIPILTIVLIDIICGLFIANSQSQVDFKVSWLTILLCLPLIGAILYLLYAQKITTKGKRALRRNVINKKIKEGRIDSTKILEELKEEELLRILKEPKNALIKQYQKLFSYDNIELKIDDEAVKSIVKKTMEEHTGARGLRALFERVMLDEMYDMPSNDKEKKVFELNKDYVCSRLGITEEK